MRETTTKAWEMDAVNNPADNEVTFTDEGSISVTEANPDRVIGANVAFDGTPSDGDKANSLLTVNFNNAPRVEMDINHEGRKFVDDGDVRVQAHIYAKSKQRGVPAVGISLEQDANLAIEATESNRPMRAAYANVSGGSDIRSAAVTISVTHINSIEFKVPSSLFSYSSSSSSDSDSESSSSSGSASSVIGSADSAATATASGLKAIFGSSNILTSSFSFSYHHYSYSASIIIGSAVEQGAMVTVGGLTATFGSDNILTSSSSSFSFSSSYFCSYSVSSVRNAAVGNGNATTNNLTATLGNYNILTSFSSSGIFFASSVIGIVWSESTCPSPI